MIKLLQLADKNINLIQKSPFLKFNNAKICFIKKEFIFKLKIKIKILTFL